MKAPLSHNFKQSLHGTQLSSSNNTQPVGMLSNTQPNTNLRKLHQRSLANQKQPQQVARTYNNEDLMSPPSIETFCAGSISQTHRQQSISSEINSSEGGRQQRPMTANRAFVMSQSYGLSGKELSQNRRQAAQSTLMTQQPLMDDFYRGGATETRNVGDWQNNRQQHSSMQEQLRQQPYQWPSVNTNSKRILDFSTGSISGNATNTQGPYQQSIPQYKSSSQGQKAATNFQNYQRRDPKVQHTFENFQTIGAPTQHQMLSSRKLPDVSGQTSPIQDSNFYYALTVTDPRTRAATNTQQTRTLSQGRDANKIQVRQEHSSPLRGTGNLIGAGYNDTQSTQLRGSQRINKDQVMINSSQLNSGFATLTGSGGLYNQFKQQKPVISSSSNMSTLQQPMSSKQQTSTKQHHNSNITQQQMYGGSSQQQSNFQTIKEPEQLRTPPVAPMIYDDALEEDEAMRGLRINDLQKRNHDGPHSSQEEFEQMVLKMQSRMKALESRYLDLANFYKRELLANGTSALNHSRFSQQQLREGDLTPYLAESQLEERKFQDPNDSQQQQPFDHNIEKDLINDLLQEKSQLEKDMQDMMIYQFQNNQISPNELNESEINVEGRIRNQQLQSQQNQTIEDLRGKIGDLLSRFQDDFLEFINRNYQSFTENDVLDMFSELRTSLEDILQQLSSFPQQFSGNNKAAVERALTTYHNDMQDTLKQAITEYELNYGYNIQTIKKTAFQLQSKHSTAQLDSKKAQIALQAIYKKCGQLQENLSSQGHGSLERSPPPMNHGRGNSQNRASINQPQMSPSSSLNGQQRLINEIQGQVQVVSQSLFQVSDKLVSGEDDLRYLMNEIEDEHQQAINRFKVNLEQLSNETYQKNLNQFDLNLNEIPSPIRGNFMNQTFDLINQQLQDINAQLETDLQMAQTDINNLKEQLNQQQHQTNLALNRVVSFGQSSSPQLPYTQSFNDVALLTDHRLSSLEFDNKTLTSQIRLLQRQLDDKSEQADRLATELAAASSSAHHHLERSRERSKERVQVEQIQFYQKKYDDAMLQTKDIVRLTQRFLVSLKKLQKAVHRKESNVSGEKVEFEESRRELEGRLKQVKRELDQLAIGAQPMKITNQEMIDEGDPYSMNGSVEARVNRYQNKVPHTLSERDYYQQKPSTNQQSRLTQNPYRDSRSQLLQSNIVYEQEEPQRQKSAGSGQKSNQRFSLSREKSPIPLRQQNPLYSRNQGNPQQRDMFRSIEAVDRFRHQPLLQSSASIKKQQTSSSAHKPTSVGGRSNEKLSSFPQQRTSTVELQYQQTLNQLRQDFSTLRNERDQLLMQVERVENELLERRQDVDRLNEEKMMKHGPEQILTDRDNQQDSTQLQQEIERLNQEIDHRDQQLMEYEQRTKQIEDSFHKQIQQLKERSQNKDLEIGQLRKTLQEHDQQSSSLKNLKADLMERIHSISQESDYKLQELEMLIQSKEQQIVKLERHVEKKAKLENNAAHKNSLNEQQYVQQIQTLKGKYQEKETKVQELQEELLSFEQSLRELQDTHALEIQRLNQDHKEQMNQIQEGAQEANSIKVELDYVKAQNDSTIKQLKSDHSKQLEKLKGEYQGRLEKDRQSSQEQMQNALNQARLEYEAAIKQRDQATKQHIQALTNDFTLKIDALTSQLNDSNCNTVNLEQQYQNTIQQLQSQVQTLQDQVKNYLGNIESLNFQVKQRSQDKSEANDQEKKALEAKLAKSAAKLVETEQALEEAEGLINEVQSENQLYKQQVSDTIKQANELQVEAQGIIDQLNQQIADACEERDQAYERVQELEQFINQANDEVQASKQAMQELESLSKKTLEDHLQAHQLHLADLTHQLSQRDSSLESLQAQYNHLLKERDGTLTQTEQEILTLQSELQVQKQAFTDSIHQAHQANSQLTAQIQSVTGQAEASAKSMGLEIASLKALCDTLNQRMTKKDQEMEGLKEQKNAEITQKQAQIETLQSQILAQDVSGNAQAQQLCVKLSEVTIKFEEANQNAQEAQQQLQEAQESHNQELQTIIAKHSTELNEVRQALTLDLQNKLNAQNQESQLKIQQLQTQIDQLQQQLTADQATLATLKESKDTQINTLTASYQELSCLKADLEAKMKEFDLENQRLNDQITTAMEEIETAAEQLKAQQDQLRAAQEQYEQSQQLISDLQTQNQSQQNDISELNHRISSLNRDFNGKTEDIQRRDQQITQLQGEKQQALDQVKELIDQSTIEKQSLEDILKSQLAQAMLNIEEKDKQLLSNQAQIEDLQKNLRESQQAVEELAERAQQAEQAFEELDRELQAKEEKLMEHQQTLAKNRDLIVMLKDEYKKVSDKEKVMVQANTQMKEREQELTNQVVDLTEQLDTLTQQNENLTEQVQRLKQEYAQKHDEAQAAQTNLLDAINNKTTEQNNNNNSSYVHQLEEEMKAKDELIDEANQCIEEFNNEKHELKAKFKHFIQVIEDPNLQPEEESSYKEDDDIDLNYAFDLFERQLTKSRQQLHLKLQSIQEENSRLKDDLEQKEDELRASMDQMGQVNAEIARMKGIVEENDKEMRRQMENAGRKMDKYKEQVRDKQAQVEQLKMSLDMLASVQVPPPIQPPVVQPKQDDAETLMLLQKLQKAEQELQQLRQQAQQHVNVNRISDPRNQSNLTNDDLHTSFKVDAERLQTMEKQLINLRRQLFEAKDQVIDQLTAEFAKKLKEHGKVYTNEQVMKSKLSELKQNLEGTLNNNVKCVKVVRFSTSVKNETIQKRLLVVQVINNNECYVIDEAKLSDTAVQYVRSYLPEAFEEEERLSLHGESKVAREMKKLEDQVREIREERLELYQELMLYKEKIKAASGLNTSNMSDGLQQNFGGLTDLRGAELEEEVTHITSENLELRQKMKQLSEQNKLLQLRVLELNDLQDGSNSPVKQMDKWRAEIESLQKQLSDERRKSGKRPSKPKVDHQHVDEDQDENSFLEGIQVAENIGGLSGNRGAEAGENNLFDQSSINLGDEYGIANDQQQDEEQHRPGTNPAGNYSEAPIQVMEKLQKENEDLRTKLQQSLQNHLQSSSVLNSGEGAGLIKHIKGTLLQFLKNCPVTDRNNEELLTIVFSMMEFTREEISEVQDFRQSRQRGQGTPGVRANSVSSGGVLGGTDPGDEELRKKTSKGIFGMFRKGSRDKKKDEEEKTSNSSQQAITPTKVLAPIGRR